MYVSLGDFQILGPCLLLGFWLASPANPRFLGLLEAADWRGGLAGPGGQEGCFFFFFCSSSIQRIW